MPHAHPHESIFHFLRCNVAKVARSSHSSTSSGPEERIPAGRHHFRSTSFVVVDNVYHKTANTNLDLSAETDSEYTLVSQLQLIFTLTYCMGNRCLHMV